MLSYDQIGGVKCSICGSEGTNKSTCPLNPVCTSANLLKHPQAASKMNKSASLMPVKEESPQEPSEKTIPSLTSNKSNNSNNSNKSDTNKTNLSETKTNSATGKNKVSLSETKTNPVIRLPQRKASFLTPRLSALSYLRDPDYSTIDSEVVKFFKPIADKEIIFEYNGEPLVLKSKFTGRDDEIRLEYTLNYADEEKTQAFIDTCTIPDRVFFVHDFIMAFQQWSVKDGKLYLENQENKYTLCKDEYTTKIFQGAARILWCIFLHNGLYKKIFNKDTIIELEAWGNLANDKIGKDSQKALELFYTKLGFKYTGKRAPYQRGSGGPYMRATVGDVIEHVCDRLPKDVLKTIIGSF